MRVGSNKEASGKGTEVNVMGGEAKFYPPAPAKKECPNEFSLAAISYRANQLLDSLLHPKLKGPVETAEENLKTPMNWLSEGTESGLK
jgi:hypothetical protein